MEDVTLRDAAYERFDLELCIAPVALEDGELGFEISVWLRCDELKLNVSDLMDSLCVMLDARHLVTEENADLYAIAWESGEEIELLDSSLALIPTIQLEPTRTEDGSVAPTLAGHYALTAPYAGNGLYRTATIESR